MPVNQRPFLKLSDLSSQINRVLELNFGSRRYWVLAEISNLNFSKQRGNYYLECIEKAEDNVDIRSRIAAIIWSTDYTKVVAFENQTGQKFKDGIQLLIEVSVNFHPVYGLKLRIHDIDPSYTIGALEKQRQATIQRLLTECSDSVRQEGNLFVTKNKLLPLPIVIQRIAVLSSSSAAGYEDFKQLLLNNEFGYTYYLDSYYTLVQGEQNAAALHNKMLEIFKSGVGYDVLVIIRGGGSQTDFLIFDQFEMGKIVARFPIPILTGIGHQKNQTIVDMMAHTANTSPSKAAEFIVAHNRKFETELVSLQRRIIIRSQKRISTAFQSGAQIHSLIINRTRDLISNQQKSLRILNQDLVRQSGNTINLQKNLLVSITSNLLIKPRIKIAGEKTQLKHLLSNIEVVGIRLIKSRQSSLQNSISMIRAMTPANILKRGFAIIKFNNEIITDSNKIQKGDKISIILSGQEIDASVNSKKQYDGKEFEI
ncbi:MAG: exodeoxyribonuclease VII large subunit [Flavitalea sp.]